MSYNVKKGKQNAGGERNEEKYLEFEKIEALKNEGWRVWGLINGYLRYLCDRKVNGQSVVREISHASTEDDESLVLLDGALNSAAPF